MVTLVANAIIAIFQFILRVLKRGICCFRRRQRLSCEPVPLTDIGVVPNVQNEDSDTTVWNSWVEMPEKNPAIVAPVKPIDPVQQQIEMYRQQRINSCKTETNEEPKIDYFQDMTPKIIRQTKMVLQPKVPEVFVNSNGFSLAPDPVFNSSELGDWEDTQSWEDQTEQDWDADNMLKEKKRLEREERLAKQQRKKMERKVRESIIMPS